MHDHFKTSERLARMGKCNMHPVHDPGCVACCGLESLGRPEETHPYCRYCGQYMGFPGVAEHAQRHRDDCKVVQWRKEQPPLGGDPVA